MKAAFAADTWMDLEGDSWEDLEDILVLAGELWGVGREDFFVLAAATPTLDEVGMIPEIGRVRIQWRFGSLKRKLWGSKCAERWTYPKSWAKMAIDHMVQMLFHFLSSFDASAGLQPKYCCFLSFLKRWKERAFQTWFFIKGSLEVIWNRIFSFYSLKIPGF